MVHRWVVVLVQDEPNTSHGELINEQFVTGPARIHRAVATHAEQTSLAKKELDKKLLAL